MGTYPIVRESDRNAGIIASAVTMLILFLYLYFKTIFMADPPPRDIPIKTETTIDQLELKDLIVENPGGQGGGTPSNDPLDEPQPQTQQVLTKPKNPTTQTTTGQSTNDNNLSSNNPSSSTQQSNNPFANGSSGGGSRLGLTTKDSNKYNETPGPPKDGKTRKRLNNVNVDHIQNERAVTIELKLTINASGEVISAANIASKTTTTDQRIINQVIAAVKSQVKYNKDPNAGLEEFVYLTVKVNAQ